MTTEDVTEDVTKGVPEDVTKREPVRFRPECEAAAPRDQRERLTDEEPLLQ